ncbi:MAG: organomercurial lyase [Acidimicrobiia bacterium]|nr:organomercurial lyase [Acidimicrobiia bacterium]
MSGSDLLDQGYAEVLRRCVATGRAPHYTELAASLGISLEEARSMVHELVRLTPGWVHPGTDLLASFPPFNLQPTQYWVTIDGDQRWFAQCGLEALAIRWLVPGQTVRIDAPCLCCGEPMVLEMIDESITTIEPEAMVGYTSSEIGGDPATRPFR